MAVEGWLANSFFKLPIIELCFEVVSEGENDTECMIGLDDGRGSRDFRQNSFSEFLSPFCQLECGTRKSLVSHH